MVGSQTDGSGSLLRKFAIKFFGLDSFAGLANLWLSSSEYGEVKISPVASDVHKTGISEPAHLVFN